MIRRFRAKRACLFYSLFLLLGFGVVQLYKCMSTIKRYAFVIDPQISERTAAAIEQFITSHPELQGDDFFAQLQQRFPSINQLSLRTLADGTMNVTIDSACPLVEINHEVIFAGNEALVPKNQYQLVDNLPTLSVAELQKWKKAVPPIFVQWLKTISSSHFEQFKITWVDEHQITFVDKKQPKVSLLCDVQTSVNEYILCQGKKVKQQVEQKGTRSRNNWVIDTRFENQIIVFAQKGDGHG